MFAAATAGSHVPADTVGAMLNVADNPTLNPTGMFALLPGNGPFQPVLAAAPSSFAASLIPPTIPTYILQIQPTSLSFSSTTIGVAAAQQTVTVQNAGNVTVTLAIGNITGTNAAEFAETNNCTGSLSVGTSCAIQVSFTPAGTGLRNASFPVVSNSSSSPQSVTLAGTGAAVVMASPRASVSIQKLNFGIYSDVWQDVTLTNTGSTTLTISGVATSTPYFTALSHCGSSLAAGASCVISVLDAVPFQSFGFLSTNDTPYVDQINITTNDTSDNLSVYLVADGGAQWNTENVQFPDVALGSSASYTLQLLVPAKVMTIQNGNATLPATPTFSGANAGDYAVSSACLPSSTQGACNLAVTFTPSAAGVRVASLNTGAGYIPVSGTGVVSEPTELTFSASSLTMANFATASVQLTNPSANVVPLSLATTSGFSQTNNCGSSLYAQSACNITVTGAQSTSGGSQGLLSVSGAFGTESIPLTTSVLPIVNFGNWATGKSSTLPRTVSGGESTTYNSLIAVVSGAQGCGFSER